MWGAMQGAEVRKDLLEADARDRESQCRSSGEKTDPGHGHFHLNQSIRVGAKCGLALKTHVGAWVGMGGCSTRWVEVAYTLKSQ